LVTKPPTEKENGGRGDRIEGWSLHQTLNIVCDLHTLNITYTLEDLKWNRV